jgi:hypothetical protein
LDDVFSDHSDDYTASVVGKEVSDDVYFSVSYDKKP